MDTDKLYRVQREDLPQLEQVLNRCFTADPLYQTLIPDPNVRDRLTPELFHCDLDEMFETCEIYADSPALHGLIVVSDHTRKRSLLHFLMTEAKALLETDAALVREDISLRTLHNFMKGENYLNSSWTNELGDAPRLHIIYLAVSPDAQHHGIAAELMDEVLRYADQTRMIVSLETHKASNVTFYQQFGFKLYKQLSYHFPLTQYCLVRDAAGAQADNIASSPAVSTARPDEQALSAAAQKREGMKAV